MASEWSKKKQNSSYRGKFQWLFVQGKGNLVRVSGEFEVWRFRFNRVKTSRKWDEIRGKLDVVRVSGEVRVIGVLLHLQNLWEIYFMKSLFDQPKSKTKCDTYFYLWVEICKCTRNVPNFFIIIYQSEYIIFDLHAGAKPPSKLTLACCKFLLIYYNKWL